MEDKGKFRRRLVSPAFAPNLVILLVAILALAIRLDALSTNPGLSGDALNRYFPIGKNLVSGNGFSRSTGPQYVPDTFDQPIYPLFVALNLQFTNHDTTSILLIQLFLEVAISVVVFFILKEIGAASSVRWLGASLCLLFPVLPYFTRVLLTEVLTTFAFALLILLAVRAQLKPSLSSFVALGLCGAFTSSIRGDAVIAVLLVFSTAAFSTRGAKSGALAKLRNFVLVLVVFIGALMPWTVRNYIILGALRPFGNAAEQTQLGYVKWLDTWLDRPAYIHPFWWNALSSGESIDLPKGLFPEDERVSAERLIYQLREENGFGGNASKGFEQLAQQAKKDRPFDVFVRVPVFRVAFTLLQVPSYSPYSTWLKFAVYGFWMVILITASIGVFWWPPGLSTVRGVLLVCILGRLVLPALSSLAAEPRYLLEALPALMVLAAVGFASIRFKVFTSRVAPASTDV